jgi:hypothetical protein
MELLGGGKNDYPPFTLEQIANIMGLNFETAKALGKEALLTQAGEALKSPTILEADTPSEDPSTMSDREA